MKFFKIYFVFIMTITLVLICSCFEKNSVNNPDPDPEPNIEEMKQELLDLINEHRTEKSLSILNSEADLDSVAFKQSVNMAKMQSTEDTGLDDLLDAYRIIYPNANIRSVLASNSNGEPSTVYSMIRDFQITLIEGDYNYIGIGINKIGSYYFTVLFCKK